MARLISKIYGEALFETAKENNCVDTIKNQVSDVIYLLTNSTDIMEFLKDPRIAESEKKDFVKDVLSKTIENVDEKILNFIYMIIDKGRQKELLDILKYFIELAYDFENIGRAEVTSATMLSDNQKELLEKKLIETTKYDSFVFDFNVDESLICGIKIKIGDKVFDKTYKTRIFDISKNLRGLKL